MGVKESMAKKKAKKAKKPAEVLIVASKVRAHVKDAGMMMAGDLPGELNCCVIGCLDAAIKRAKANGRKTVKPQDI